MSPNSTGRAGKLIERALVLAPDSGKALFFGAATAARRGDLPLARERFARLLSMNPPDNVRPLIEQQISALDEKLAGRPPPAAAPQPGAAAADAAVRVNVTLGARAGGRAGRAAVRLRAHAGRGRAAAGRQAPRGPLPAGSDPHARGLR